VVEDVITTGKSALQAIDAVRRQGAEVVGVLAVVDREEGGVEAIKNSGCEVISLTSIRSLTTSAF
jgi:orotate phosphoribosyltransferase